MKVLKIGSKGGDVKILQEYLSLPVDGSFGPKTESAVKCYQSSHGMKADGIVGKTTWMSLAKAEIANTTITNGDYIKAAIDLDVDLACVKAVKTVESGGTGIKNGKPVILFEGHVFWSELKKKGINPEKYVKGNENVLYPKWVKTYYSKTQEGEWARLTKAMKIDKDAALRSASYGLFQIMGNNCLKCGYKTAEEMVNAYSKSEENQLNGFIQFIKNAKLDTYLRSYDWAGFAKRYNGAGYAANKYDIKLKQAFLKYN